MTYRVRAVAVCVVKVVDLKGRNGGGNRVIFAGGRGLKCRWGECVEYFGLVKNLI